MGGLSSVFDFELFNLKDMLKKIGDEPLSALVGGLTPIGAELWKGLGVLDKDFDPPVNILGGPKGGDTLGIGSGGVFDRAQAEGIDTSLSQKSHDAAEVVASLYGIAGLSGAGGGAGNALTEIPAGDFAPLERSTSFAGGGGTSGFQNVMDKINQFSNIPQPDLGQGAGTQQAAQGPSAAEQQQLMVLLAQAARLRQEAEAKEREKTIGGLLSGPTRLA